MRNILYLFLSLISASAFSAEISLSCDIQVEFIASNGDTVKQTGNAIVDIVDEPNFKMITIASDVADANNLTVSTRLPSTMRGNVSDFSSKSKWDIQTVIERDNGRIVNRVVIDRVTGLLIVNGEFNRNGKKSITNVGGKCKKIDHSNRKF